MGPSSPIPKPPIQASSVSASPAPASSIPKSPYGDWSVLDPLLGRGNVNLSQQPGYADFSVLDPLAPRPGASLQKGYADFSVLDPLLARRKPQGMTGLLGATDLKWPGLGV